MKSKKCTLGLLIFYLIALTWIIVFKLQFSVADLPHLRNVNFIPFAESVLVNGTIEFREIIQNLLAFVPYGLFIHVLWEEKPVFKQLLPVICTSFVFETVQFIFAIGATDITDMLTNSSGGFLGIMMAVGISKISSKNWIKIINAVSLTGAILLTAFLTILLAANL